MDVDEFSAPVSLEQFQALRSTLLGREPDLAADGFVRAEFEYLRTSGDLSGLVRQWLESDEFVVNWPRVRAFERLQQNSRVPAPAETRCVVHIHIPKTAGTTLNHVFGEHFDVTEAFYQRPLTEFLALPVGRMLAMRFVGGHFGRTVVELLGERNPFVVTMVRHPVDHMASLRRHLIKVGRLDPSLSLVDWLRLPKTPNNFQCTRLVPDYRLGAEMADSGEGMLAQREPEQLRADVELALARIDLVAPTERVQDVYLAMCAAAGIQAREFDEFPVMNPTHEEDVDETVRDLVAAKAPLDMWLYELACRTEFPSAGGGIDALQRVSGVT